MIYRLVKLTLKEEEIGSFFDVFETKKRVIAGAEGCISMRMLQDQTDKRVVFTYSTWEGLEYLEKYRESSEFILLWKAIKPFFLLPAEVWTMDNRHAYSSTDDK
jgi:heme-degrading monooxygenase HmoA